MYSVVTIATRLCVIAADVLLLVVTWRKTYATKRDADRYGIETPFATMLLRDGKPRGVLSLTDLIPMNPGTVYFVYVLSAIVPDELRDVHFCSLLLCLNILNMVGNATNVSDE